MAQGLEFDLKQAVLSNSSFGPAEINQLVETVDADYTQFSILRDSVQELETREDRTPATAVRLGVCQYLLGHFAEALETLASADGGALSLFYVGRCQAALDDHEPAMSSFQASQGAGYAAEPCVLATVDSLRSIGRSDEALSALDSLSGAVEQTADYLYQRGSTVSALGGNPMEVVALYERAVDTNGKHAGALFGLALENDRRGNDNEALRHYQTAAARFPTNVGCLLNLGIMYEDREQYDRAQQCYQRILDVCPTDPRAKLFLKDAQASGDMYYDEDAQKRRDRLQQVLSIPVTDFELSVRSRNCLQKMGILTLGDLSRCSEAELLASKNFGETSLVEIREMLTSRGLDLGQFSHEKAEPEPSIDTSSMSADEQALLDRPISDLNLSVRARKCMVRLGLNTIGELLRRTGDDLLECKNFGVTSLNEVREKLTLNNLKLRGD
jgi:DNA-directed RNA polymerase subunit alpha